MVHEPLVDLFESLPDCLLLHVVLFIPNNQGGSVGTAVDRQTLVLVGLFGEEEAAEGEAKHHCDDDEPVVGHDEHHHPDVQDAVQQHIEEVKQKLCDCARSLPLLLVLRDVACPLLYQQRRTLVLRPEEGLHYFLVERWEGHRTDTH